MAKHKDPAQDETKRVLFVRGMPKALMCHFAAWCKLRGISQKSKLISMIRECLKDSTIK